MVLNFVGIVIKTLVFSSAFVHAKSRYSTEPHAFSFIFIFSPLLVCSNLCFPATIKPPFSFFSPLHVSSVFPSASLPALQLIWEGDPWALKGQVIQGHWRVITADWPTSKKDYRKWPIRSSFPPPTLRRPPPHFPTSPAHQQLVSHDQGEASEGGWLMMLLVPV